MIKKGFIFNENREQTYTEMVVSTEAYEIISNIIADTISEILCKSYADKSNFTLLISNAIKPQVRQLITEHENHCLEVSSGWIKDELELDSDINYQNALHAKLNDIKNEISGKYISTILMEEDGDIFDKCCEGTTTGNLQIELNEYKCEVEKLTSENEYMKDKISQLEEQYRELMKR